MLAMRPGATIPNPSRGRATIFLNVENQSNYVANSRKLNSNYSKINTFWIRFFFLQTARNKSKPSTFIQQDASRAQTTPLYIATAVQWEGSVCRRVGPHLESGFLENRKRRFTTTHRWLQARIQPRQKLTRLGIDSSPPKSPRGRICSRKMILIKSSRLGGPDAWNGCCISLPSVTEATEVKS